MIVSPLSNFTVFLLAFSALAFTALVAAPTDGEPAPMKFMDVLQMRSAGNPAVSADGKWMLYTLTVPDWKAAKSYTDIYLVSTAVGVKSARQMTFTKDKSEGTPLWSPDGKFFVFLSDRDGVASPTAASSTPTNQLYLMHPDGGEARKITDAKDGVSAPVFSKDGKWLAFAAGKEDAHQIWVFNVATIESEPATQLTKHATAINHWQFAPDSQTLYFTAPEDADAANKERKLKKFDVRIRNEIKPRSQLWALNLGDKKEKKLTSDAGYSVIGVTVSKDSKWLGFHGTPDNRYYRNVTDAPNYADLYLLEVASGKIERLTENKDSAESELSFSPDSRLLAFSATDNFDFFRNGRVYMREVGDAGGKLWKLGDGFDADVSIGFWSEDSRTIYFNEGLRATTQLCGLDIASGKVQQITQLQGVASVAEDEPSQRLVITYSDPTMPNNMYTVDSVNELADRSAWRQLTDSNPQVGRIALGRVETIQWKSSDGKMIEGILTRPVGYQQGQRYPLILQIHGGPQSADLLKFNTSAYSYSHVFAGAGYATFQPNYRGSTNYGEQHKMEISGDYFRQAYDDIISGVDHLIAEGIVDPDKIGAMGWSAGGHWCNWILTHTDRFKAISSGAGAVNWISMYAQSDTQRVREFYFQGQPYGDFAKYWDLSPLKFIKNAKTPTLIHVVDGDPRVPRPQSEELHMALRQLGVPTELMVYPGSAHSIAGARNLLAKMTAEFKWFEKYVRGKEGWLDWKELLATVKEDKPAEKKEPAEPEKSGELPAE